MIVLYRSMKAASPERAPESLLNDLGYALLNQRRNRDAVAIFEENARQFPRSANVYDSLGDAYLAAGNREAAAHGVSARGIARSQQRSSQTPGR